MLYTYVYVKKSVKVKFGCTCCRSLRSEKVDLRDQKEHRLAEREKSALHGKKSRKERKMLKESVVAARRHSPRRWVYTHVCVHM